MQMIKILQDRLAVAQAMATNNSNKGSSANEASFSSTNSHRILVPKPQRYSNEVSDESIFVAPEEIQK